MSKPGADNRTLPTKEAGLFKQVIKHYESKQYKKGLKAADSILRKAPEHGETLAMKGLLLNCLGRKDEAYDLVKRGVKNDLRSHVCWHVYGLLYRSDREYDEAIKCYKQALRMESDNPTVLRDLALLQVQMRDLGGFVETRTSLLEARPSNRQNWLSLAVAHHLAGHCQVAAEVLEAYEGTLGAEDIAAERYEYGEVLLYKAQVLEEGGLHGRALSALDAAEARGHVRDRLAALEARGRLLRALDRHAEAEALTRQLLRLNPDHYGYHRALVESLEGGKPDPGGRLTPEQCSRLVAAYGRLQAEHPHSSAARRIPLDFLEGSAFEEAADLYVRRYILKGIPSLFSDLRPLYKDAAKAAALGALFERLERSLEATGRLPPPPAGPFAAAGGSAAAHHAAGEHAGDAEGHELSPQALTWVRLYRAQHCDELGDTGSALHLLDAAAEHAPALAELHSARARVLRRAGDAAGAAAEADAARQLDPADRFLNCAAVKALYRAGEVEKAEATAALFTRGEGGGSGGAAPPGDPSPSLFDMQATWYELAGGRAYLARGEHGKALKRFLKVDSHWADFGEDQFDFHQYCVRKQTLRAYVAMLRMEDGVYRHPVYAKAVHGAVQAYLQLADAASAAAAAAAAEEQAAAGLSPEEARRARQKARKEEARRAKAEGEAKAAAAAAAADAARKAPADKAAADKKADPDPDGAQLAAASDPLGEAARLAARLAEAAGDRPDTQALAFEVALRRGRLLQALRAAKRGAALVGCGDPVAHSMLVRLALAARAAEAGAEQAAAANGPEGGAAAAAAAAAAQQQREVVSGLLRDELSALLGGKPPAEYNAAWAAAHGGGSLRAAAVAAELAVALRPAAKAEAVAALLAAKLDGASHADCVAVHALLSATLGDAAGADAWRAKCAQRFRWSRAFGGADVLPLPGPAGAGVGGGAANGLASVAV